MDDDGCFYFMFILNDKMLNEIFQYVSVYMFLNRYGILDFVEDCKFYIVLFKMDFDNQIFMQINFKD